MIFRIPGLRLPSLSNLRSQWMIRAAKKDAKLSTWVAMRGLVLPELPVIVTITRVGPRRLDDDNLAAACKYVRDQIADAFGEDDGSDQYTWRYEQRTGEYAVEVEITSRERDPPPPHQE